MPVLNVRITEAQALELERRAGGNVSAYVRQQLFAPQEHTLDRILHHLEDLPHDLERTPTSEPSDSSATMLPMLSELLLMLRSTVKPTTRQMAQSELERVGMKVWEPDDHLG